VTATNSKCSFQRSHLLLNNCAKKYFFWKLQSSSLVWLKLDFSTFFPEIIDQNFCVDFILKQLRLLMGSNYLKSEKAFAYFISSTISHRIFESFMIFIAFYFRFVGWMVLGQLFACSTFFFQSLRNSFTQPKENNRNKMVRMKKFVMNNHNCDSTIFLHYWRREI
jgi:hypothetical protein